MLTLRAASLADLPAAYPFLRDMPADENGMTNVWHGVDRETFATVALPQMLAHARGEELPAGWVPQTTYFLWRGDEIVGLFRIRHYLTDALRTGAGHIGYTIRRDCRGQGYATEGLRQTLDHARRIVPEDEIYLRVNRDNAASLRVMMKCGGRVVAEDGEKFYVRVRK